MSRLKRKTSLKESIQEIKKTEIKVLEACNWNPLYTTLLEVLEFYLTQGVVFSSDSISPSIADAKILTDKGQNPVARNSGRVGNDELCKKAV